MKKFILLAAMCLSAPAFAADVIGNGGDVVLCKGSSGAMSSIEMLDNYEGREAHKLAIDLGSAQLSVEEKVKLALARLRRLDPMRADYLANELDQFNKSSEFKAGIELVDVPDSLHDYKPKDCEVVQIAIQKEPSKVGGNIYLVSKDLWDQLDNDNRATLILHEIIYRAALRLGHKNSIPSRYLTAWVSSAGFDQVDMNVYRQFIVDHNLLINYGRINLQFNDVVYYKGSLAPKMALVSGSTSNEIWLDGIKVYLEPLTPVTYFKSGAIRSFCSAHDFTYRGFRVQGGSEVCTANYKTTLFENGDLRIFSSPVDNFFSVGQGSKVKIAAGDRMNFYPGSRLQSSRIRERTKIRHLNQELVLRGDGSGEIQFYPNGYLQRGNIENPFEFIVDGRTFQSQGREYPDVSFGESGLPSYGYVKSAFKIKFQGGSAKLVPGTLVRFSSDGKINQFGDYYPPIPGFSCKFKFRGVDYSCRRMSFYPSGKVEVFMFENYIPVMLNGFSLQAHRLIEFFESGQIKSLNAGGAPGFEWIENTPHGQISFTGGPFTFYEDGKIESGRIKDTYLNIRGLSVEVNGVYTVSLYPSRKLKYAHFKRAYSQTVHGQSVTFRDSGLYFDEQGVVRSGSLLKSALVKGQSGTLVRVRDLDLDREHLQREWPTWLVEDMFHDEELSED